MSNRIFQLFEKSLSQNIFKKFQTQITINLLIKKVLPSNYYTIKNKIIEWMKKKYHHSSIFTDNFIFYHMEIAFLG